MAYTTQQALYLWKSVLIYYLSFIVQSILKQGEDQESYKMMFISWFFACVMSFYCLTYSFLFFFFFFCLVTISQGGTIQTVTNSGAPQPGATIVQYAAQSSDGTQQFFVPGSQVVVQGIFLYFFSLLHLQFFILNNFSLKVSYFMLTLLHY